MSPSFPRDIQRAVLRDIPKSPTGYAYGAITLYGAPFQGTSASRWGFFGSPATPHPPTLTSRGSVCPVPLSLAGTYGIPVGFFSCGYSDVSFPRVPAPYGAPRRAGSPIRESRDLRLLAPPPGLSQLATPFVGARAEPSTRWANGPAEYPDFTRALRAYARPSSFIGPFTHNFLKLWAAFIFLVDPVGFEPTASGLQGRRSPS